MHVDGNIGETNDRAREGDLAVIDAETDAAERIGYDGLWTTETRHDPFLPLLRVAGRSPRIQIGTAIAVAFARSPMTTATVANDMQSYSGGRFTLGLGSQIKPHIERRFSMPWSSPAARMREYVAAMRAIWASWHSGEKLDFRGEFYQHTLMTPMFSPGPNPYGTPPVLIAAGYDEPTLTAAVAAVRERIAFYGSTPAYRGVLELHGWGELQTELQALSKQGRWDEMTGLIEDPILHAFAVVGEPGQVGKEIGRRFGGVVDRFTLYSPYPMSEAVARAVASEVPREA